jgi:aspartyl/asparaginyl beta-hydroxylase (cupin superfamily)
MDKDVDLRVRQLFESAAHALEGGRAKDAEELLRRAEAEAPRHPLVRNEIARRMLLAGNWAGAQEVLEQAVKEEPSYPTLWLNLAAALRGLQRADEELAALKKALSLEPRNLRALLQLGTLQEMQGNTRGAAATYHLALQVIPRDVEPPPGLRPALQHAREVIEANDRALEAFLEKRLTDLRARYAGVPLGRFDRCLAILLRKQPIYRQQPTFMYFPNLPVIEFHERGDFPWLDSIEAATDDIRAELVKVLREESAKLQPYISLPDTSPLRQWKDLNNSRRWSVYYLWREGVAVQENLARCPRTAEALKAWPQCDVPGYSPSAVFSILDARTRIPPHTGVNNTRLIVHLPLIVPPGCGFRVGGERREWHPGKAFVFDDTIEHEAWNDSDVPRAVLIFDIWSPFVNAAEREMVRSATVAVGEYYGTRAYRED